MQLLGALLIGVGSWAEEHYGDFVEITKVDYASATRLVIAVGIIIVITALFGFCGAVFLNKCMLRVVSGFWNYFFVFYPDASLAHAFPKDPVVCRAHAYKIFDAIGTFFVF